MYRRDTKTDASLDLALRRAVRSTGWTAAGVLRTGGSTMILIHGAAPGATALPAWTVFAADAALPGHGSAPAILAGPVIAIAALIAVLHARASIRRLGGTDQGAVRSPLEDVARLLDARTEPPTALLMLAPTTIVAAAAAFLRDAR